MDPQHRKEYTESGHHIYSKLSDTTLRSALAGAKVCLADPDGDDIRREKCEIRISIYEQILRERGLNV